MFTFMMVTDNIKHYICVISLKILVVNVYDNKSVKISDFRQQEVFIRGSIFG